MREATLVKATTRETSKTVVTIPSICKSAADLVKFNGTSAVGILHKRSVENNLISNFTIHDCVVYAQTHSQQKWEGANEPNIQAINYLKLEEIL